MEGVDGWLVEASGDDRCLEIEEIVQTATIGMDLGMLSRKTKGGGKRRAREKREDTKQDGKSSDHKPILLTMNRRDRFTRKDCRIFRFEASWNKEEGCEKVIQEAWRSNEGRRGSQTPITKRLERCRGALLGWCKQFKLDRNQEIKLKTEALTRLQDEESCLNAAEIKKLQKEVGTLLEKEDIKWKQRAKRNWYAKGDRNTKYFHACTNQRRRKNTIKQIEDGQGRICKDQEGIEGAFKGYFESLFNSTQPSSEEMEDCLKHLEPRATREANDKLLRPFSKGEIEEAIKSMAPLKSPGPDGFGSCFYQNHWKTIGDDVCAAVLNHLNGTIPFQLVNFTFIALIPKKKDPKVVIEYRPISLCNVFYKIISKVLVNRFKGVLTEIISTNQSAFILGRIITDNIMIAYEILHTMKVGKKGKKGNMVIKLDMSKTYDRIEWPFVKAVMKKFGLCDDWIKIVMRLSSLLNHSDLTGNTKGVTVVRGGSRVNHLLFADDCILFGRACVEEWKRLQELLLRYEKASGQFLNKEKTSVFFSSNTHMADRDLILRAGGPWSKAAMKNTLVQAAIPSYTMSVFKLPKKLCKEINIMLSKFWWEAKLGNAHSLIWRSVWNSLGLLKEGLRWKVGDGEKINIWGKKWLLSPSTFCVQSPISILDENSKVRELIDDVSKDWNEGLIRSIFNKEEADHICSIPMSTRGVEDKLIWGPSRKCVFSVKSAYFLDENRKKVVVGDSSRENEKDSRWKSIWEMKVPGKVKLFMWKRRLSCMFYGSAQQQVVCGLRLIVQLRNWGAMETDLLKLWEDLEGKPNKIELEEVAVIMRGLWMRMNSFIFDNKFLNPSSIIRATRESLEEYHLAEEGTTDSSRGGDSRVEVIQKWSPPGANSFKANWDAACNVKLRKMGVGVIIRDENGAVTTTYCGIKGNVDQPVIAKGITLGKAMELCRDLGLNKVTFEGNAQNIVKAVYSPDENLSCLDSIIEDSKSFLSEWSNWSSTDGDLSRIPMLRERGFDWALFAVATAALNGRDG
ncbi:hypothetical protein F2P56_002506 [Juglans regia]|uniref:Uncharacterized protein LOC109009239 n=2 Tax=Juglans regia TaxID=51240 RepID=A0A2I4GMS3_JUGRE|nr:uncharacterized protein LOC109009239 [Juglans regia]KAF5481894.1 hypothetical protein F2P56_002506 [Juglans regia]